jgi:uncharacterized protein YlxP (DUF503 family)
VVVGICTIDFFLPGCSSLKDKRMVIRSFKDRLRQRHNVAVAEVEFQDLWQRARLGVASVSSARSVIDSTFQAVLKEAERIHAAELLDFQVEIL